MARKFRPTFFDAEEAPGQALAGNPRRHYLFIQNQGTQPVWVDFGKTPVVNESLLIERGGFWEASEDSAPGDPVEILSETGTQRVYLIEADR